MNLRAAFLLALLLFAAPAAHALPKPPKPPKPPAAAATPTAAVNYGSPLADSLVAFLEQLKRHDYAGLGGITLPGATPRPRLGADQLALVRDDDGGITLCLYYLVANRQGKVVGRRAKAAFEQLAGAGPFTLGEGGPHSASLLENGREVFSYWMPNDVTLTHCLILRVSQLLPPRPVLADEAAYGGRFPTAPTARDTPQIWQVAGGPGTAAGAYVRYNGRAPQGVLVRGTKTFHGYSPFLDGTWQSDEWGPSTTTIKVVLHPADGSAEVEGRCKDQEQMQDFSPNGPNDYFYDSGNTPKNSRLWGSPLPGAPPWLTYGLGWRTQQKEAAVRAQQAQYERDHPSVPGTRTYARPTDPAPTYQPTNHEVTCGVCGGSGWVSGRNYGQRDQCGSCGGRGKVVSKY